MNLLPFISIFLLVFALLSSTMMTRTKTTLAASKSHKNYMVAERETRNKAQERMFEKLVKKHPEKPPIHQAKKKKKQEYVSPRVLAQHDKRSKLNLFLLISERHPPKSLRLAFDNLLESLYGETIPHEDLKEIPEKIINRGRSLIEKAKKKSENIENFILTDLLEVEDPISYKILRGTNYYDADKRVGIAPIGDFMYFDKKGAPLYTSLASATLLKLLFGPEKQEELAAKEKKKEKFLTLSEFQEVVPEKLFSKESISTSSKIYKTKPDYLVGECDKIRVKKLIN